MYDCTQCGETLRIRMLCVSCVYAMHPFMSCDPVCVQGSDVQQLSSQAMQCISAFPVLVCFTVFHDHELTGWKDPERGEISAQADLLCTSWSWSLPVALAFWFVLKPFKVLSVAVATQQDQNAFVESICDKFRCCPKTPAPNQVAWCGC